MPNTLNAHGNVGADPKVTTTAAGVMMVRFNLAADDVWWDKENQRQKHTEWFSCVAFGPTGANLAKYVTKGQELVVWGHLRTRTYQDQGQERSITELRVDRWEFCGKRDRRDDDEAPGSAGEDAWTT